MSQILELPCFKWTNQYKTFLNKLFEKDDNKVSDMREHHTSDGVKFVLTAPSKFWDEVESKDGGLQQYFKLETDIRTGNKTFKTAKYILTGQFMFWKICMDLMRI